MTQRRKKPVRANVIRVWRTPEGDYHSIDLDDESSRIYTGESARILDVLFKYKDK